MTNANKIKIEASILPVYSSMLNEEIRKLEESKIDIVHFDVMDGIFVENKTFGPELIESVRDVTKLPFHAHLMIVNPENQIEKFAKVGSDIITVHYEVGKNSLEKSIKKIKSYGKGVGIAINPSTPWTDIEGYLKDIDLVLVMSVEPGAAGQPYIDQKVKLEGLKGYIDKNSLDTDIGIDGGINAKIARTIHNLVNIIISASSIFNHPEGYKQAVDELRGY